MGAIQTITPHPLSDLPFIVTRRRIDEVVKQIVSLANPLRVVAFGSWARGEHRPDSDIDLAIIVDGESHQANAGNLYGLVKYSGMAMDLLTVPLERFELFRHSVNSVHYDIDHEGVVMYERNDHGSAIRTAAA